MPTNPHKKRYRKDLRDAHREYVRERKEIGFTGGHPTYHEYSGMVVDFFKEIFKMILFEDFTFVTNIGTFTLCANKREFGRKEEPKIDIVKTIEKGKKHYFINDHSYGYVYKMAWIRDKVNIKNIKIYELKISSYKKLREEYLGKGGMADYIKESSRSGDKQLPIPKELKYRL